MVYALAASDVGARAADGSGSSAPKELPQAERAARMSRLRQRLPGLDLQGLFEPAHHLIDLAVTMADEGSLRYLSWQECISREDELAGLKKAREWKPDSATGNLREVYKVIEAKTDVSMDYRVMQALSRRAAALDLAN
eukprot:6460728-Amphidinium_carterae.1